MHLFASFPLLAQAAPSPVTWVLAGLGVLLILAVIFLLLVIIPMLRSSVDRAHSEREAALIQLDSQSADILKRLDAQRQASNIQLSEQRHQLESQVTKLQAEVARLEQLAAKQAELELRLRNELVDAKLTAHVKNGLSNRLEANLHERNLQLEAAQRRVVAAGTAAAAQTAMLHSQLQDARLDIHVRRGMQMRLETTIRQLDNALRARNAETTDLGAQVEQFQNAVRSQSEAMINARLADAEGESERLRRLRDQLGSPDLSPQEILEAMANAANGRVNSSPH